MRRADRSDVTAPASLVKDGGKGKLELEKVRAHRADPATREKSFPFAAYKDDGVKSALARLFHGKCAYCETFYDAQAPVDVEHFRPKGAVEGADGHPGYWWLGMAWTNLLPSCIDCNRRRRQKTPNPTPSLAALHEAATKQASTGKKDAFPVAGTRAADEPDSLDLEQPFLLDPTVDDPADHLEFFIDPDHLLGLVLPRRDPGAAAALPAIGDAADVAAAAAAAGVSLRGAVSIQVYGLNRLGLVQERTRVLRRLEFLRGLIAGIDTVARRLEASADAEIREAAATLDTLIDRILAEMREMAAPDQPYSALVAAWIERFKEELTA